MRVVLQFIVVLCVAGSTGQAEPSATQPAGAIRGHLSANTGWDSGAPHPPGRCLPCRRSGSGRHRGRGAGDDGTGDKTFTPSFAVISCGTEVEFPNWDHISHNVFSRSKAAPAFDLDRYPYGYSKTRTFDKVGVVQVFCNIHQQMHAVIVVTPNAFFARADAEGRFELRGVPQGRHELVVWHERCDDQHQVVDVTAGEGPELTFVLSESRRKIIANDPPERRSGYGVERGLGVKREKLDLPVVKDAPPGSGAVTMAAR